MNKLFLILISCVVIFISSTAYADKVDNSIIRFKAEWCKPCKEMDPVFKNNDVVKELSKYAKFSVVDVDKNPEIARKYKIEYLPSLLVIDKDGKAVKLAYGTMTKDEVIKFLRDKQTVSIDGKPQPVLFGGMIRISGLLGFVGGILYWLFN